MLIMYDSCNNLLAEVVVDVCEYFGEKVYKMVIFCNVWVFEVLFMGKLVLFYDFSCVGFKVYVVFVKEVV